MGSVGPRPALESIQVLPYSKEHDHKPVEVQEA